MAQQFGPALEQRNDRLMWALIDSGGPYWTLTYDDYLSLKPEGQTRTVAGLEDLAVTTASAILDVACDDRWEDIRTEVSDPFARLTSYTDKAKKASNWRIDLLAHRGRRPPVVVDLKTGDDPADPDYINPLAVQVASQYSHEVATIIDSRVTCRSCTSLSTARTCGAMRQRPGRGESRSLPLRSAAHHQSCATLNDPRRAPGSVCYRRCLVTLTGRRQLCMRTDLARLEMDRQLQEHSLRLTRYNGHCP